MRLSELLVKENILFIEDGVESLDKTGLIERMCTRLAAAWPGSSSQTMVAEVLRREESLSTRLNSLIAFPHAVLSEGGENRIVIAVLKRGIPWDTDQEHPVRLVILQAGGREGHLEILSQIAQELRDPELVRSLVESRNADEFLVRLDRGRGGFNPEIAPLLLEQALTMQERLSPSRILLHVNQSVTEGYLSSLLEEYQLTPVLRVGTRLSNEFLKRYDPPVVPIKESGRGDDIEFSLLYLLSRRLIDREELLINLFARREGRPVDSIRIVDADRDLDLRFAEQLGEFAADIDLNVFSRVLQIASQLAAEGREGKPVGTLFVIGENLELTEYTRQMIINPFKGYPPEERNILDPSIEETVKEYARIDGAFIIAPDGTIESAGTYLSGHPGAEELHSGLGARHAAAQGISAVSGATAVAISESTRQISIYRGGRLVMSM